MTYTLRYTIEAALKTALVDAGAAVAYGADNPSALPVVSCGMSSDPIGAPSVVVAVLSGKEQENNFGLWHVRCSVEIATSADKDDSDSTDDPVAAHRDNTGRVFDALITDNLPATLSGATLIVQTNGVQAREFRCAHDAEAREFIDELMFTLICTQPVV